MVKTRFAPSPTGYLHVGGLRTAIYAYLFAKKNGGKLILRIEDTDQKRQVEGAEENLIKTLGWAGITFDEGPHVGGHNGPYRQSDRTEIYQEHAQILINKGSAYKCFCSSERLEELRQKQEASKIPTGYDAYCRSLSEQEVHEKIASGLSFVIRLKVPKDELILFQDVVRGKVKFATNTIDDQVLMKSDHFPTYHLANVVDDHLMGITHVIRGEEWLPSSPKHILLYQAFEWEAPEFAHLPLILNEDRSKLSKRQGDVAVEDYMKKGYAPEEMNNFIAFLGWNPGEVREIYSLAELEEIFDLKKVQKAGAVFDINKLNWFRGVWRQRKLKNFAEKEGLEMNLQETKQGGFKIDIMGDENRYKFAKELLPFVEDHLSDSEQRDEHFLLRCLYTVKDKVIQEPEKVEEYIGFYFGHQEVNTSLFPHEKMKVDMEMAKHAVSLSLKALADIQDWQEQIIKEKLMEAIQSNELKNGQVLWPLRVALTRVQFSPGAFESAWIFGKEKTMSLLAEAQEVLGTQ